MAGFEKLTEDDIRRRLAEPPSPDLADELSTENPYPSGLLPDAPRPAAVLVPFLQLDGDWHILFTRRTETLAEHSGQVAFPGGRMDPHESIPEQTALREAYEEIGLQPATVRILGRLDPFVTITNYHVTPVVGRIDWPFPFRLALEEVSRVFTIPLSWLADPKHSEIQERELPPPYGPVSVIYFKPYEEEILWGVSARITYNLLRRLVWRTNSIPPVK